MMGVWGCRGAVVALGWGADSGCLGDRGAFGRGWAVTGVGVQLGGVSGLWALFASVGLEESVWGCGQGWPGCSWERNVGRGS